MGLRSDVTKTVEVPGDPGQSLTIRMVAWTTLDKAKDIRTRELAAQFAAMGDAVDRLQSNGEKPDRLLQFDKFTLLKHGIVAWSYPDELNIERLEPPVVEWAAREILDYTFPDATQVKSVASPSTGS